ncbi:hypothetical protein HDU87_000479 [Geranomyces variabilis]|uniref:CDP-alcohol phosphatidyltransferase n=1 Tax=Geranomyces variabilis TaxID=109894 RepID=A0AAD5THQ3_9FUNG|nr:hypothetical protein HDU87_000479 [Geranomyces variabilis]
MRKVSAELENPIDDILLHLAEVLCPVFRKTGHTPNMITLYSCISGAYALYSLYKRDVATFSIAWAASYFLDCLDGHYARKYSMVTVFGDYFDHISDAVQAAIAMILVISYKPPLPLVVLLMVNMYLSLVHFGCQERMYKASPHYDGIPAATLDAYKGMCPNQEDIGWTRLFGAGTLNVAFIVTVWYTLRQVTGS